MKKINLLRTLSATAIIIATQTLAAQSPTISKQYSDAEIATIVQNFRTSHTRETVAPADLQAKFKSDFPKAYDVEWETANEIYEVEFNIKLRDFKALYDSNGNLLSITEEIRPSELPVEVKNAAEAKYPKYRFEDIDKIRQGAETFYKIEMERGESEVKIFIKSDGKVINEKFDY